MPSIEKLESGAYRRLRGLIQGVANRSVGKNRHDKLIPTFRFRRMRSFCNAVRRLSRFVRRDLEVDVSRHNASPEFALQQPKSNVRVNELKAEKFLPLLGDSPSRKPSGTRPSRGTNRAHPRFFGALSIQRLCLNGFSSCSQRSPPPSSWRLASAFSPSTSRPFKM